MCISLAIDNAAPTAYNEIDKCATRNKNKNKTVKGARSFLNIFFVHKTIRSACAIHCLSIWAFALTSMQCQEQKHEQYLYMRCCFEAKDNTRDTRKRMR